MRVTDPKEYKEFFKKKDKLGLTLGYNLISISEEECIYEYEVNPNHFNPNGILHGGALFSAMDSSQGAFMHFILDESYAFAATGTATIKYLAPLTEGKIKIRTYLEERKKRKYIVVSQAFNEEGKEVARMDEIWIAVLKKS